MHSGICSFDAVLTCMGGLVLGGLVSGGLVLLVCFGLFALQL